MKDEKLTISLDDCIVDTANELAKLIEFQIASKTLDSFEMLLNHHGWFKERTCKVTWKPNKWGFKSAYCECGNRLLEIANGLGEYLPNYCHNCGVRVVDE